MAAIAGSKVGRKKKEIAMRKLILSLVLGVAVLGFTMAAPAQAQAGPRFGQTYVYTNPYVGTYYNNWGYTSYYVNPSYTSSYSYPGYGTSTLVVSPARARVMYRYPGYSTYYYTPGYFYSTYLPW